MSTVDLLYFAALVAQHRHDTADEQFDRCPMCGETVCPTPAACREEYEGELAAE